MIKLGEPKIIDREPYLVVGAYCAYQGEDEGPGWSEAFTQFSKHRDKIVNRKDDTVLGFLYRPHKDHPDIPESIKACFVGVDVVDLDCVPEPLSTTQFSGGEYVMVACQGDTQDEASMGVGEGVGFLETWIREHGYTEGDACFACSHENTPKPPFVEYVYIKIEPKSKQA